jgi:hypothetical protein
MIFRKKYERTLKDVKNGETIKINVNGFIIPAICINNCPSDRKMYLRKMFADKNIDCVEKYNDYTFNNFNVLNNIKKSSYKNRNEKLNRIL